MTEQLKQRKFLVGLRALDAHLQSIRLPEDSSARLIQRLAVARIAPSRKTGLTLGLLAACAAVLLVTIFWWSRPRTAMGFTIVQASDGFRWVEVPESVLKVVDGTGVLEASDLAARMEVAKGCRIKRENGMIRVLQGKVAIHASAGGRPGQSLRIGISHGFIEVWGTSFTVIQRDDQGEVTLHSGRIRFVAFSGKVVEMLPGETLSWPLAREMDALASDPLPLLSETTAGLPEKVAETFSGKGVVLRSKALSEALSAKEDERHPKIPPPWFDVKGFMTELEQLRIQRRFAELADRIQAAYGLIPDHELREILSYEAGDILTHRLHDSYRACRHWEQHLKWFPNGRYQKHVELAQRLIPCGAQP